MKQEYAGLALHDNTYDQQFELVVSGLTAFLEYQLHHEFLTLIHTEVPVIMQNQGVGSALVEKVFQRSAEHHLTIIPLCPFVVSYLRRHPEWYRLVARGYRPAGTP
ncbi:GNAT family N-acetyltransferase [Hymenobacter fodinae]|uniref:N-acetyltransferase n=1 Tax=Hymenobacter fodinae TaxID=2510796 RepID=A0A4Z0NZ12_9BACT|nr:GNAT family N-acetyltransferase [Hymenobacter fodinae]TGE03782.1 N-acetyltransferase [Hymenobacter fodinae]